MHNLIIKKIWNVIQFKRGADFVYRMEGCGEPESDKRYNTPHLIDMGYRRTKIRLAIY